MATTKQLRTVLAMPASLRPFLLRASSRARAQAQARASTLPMRLFSTSPLRYATARCPNVAALLVPEYRTSPLVEVTPGDLFSSLSLPSAPPDESLQDGLAKLFTRNPPAFAHSGSDFYQLRMNTRVPEVCILGRSNVGKSSFVNALASRQTNTLAFVSSKAGRTRTINTYGFGPAPLVKDLVGQSAIYKGKEDIPTHAFYLVDMPGYGHASLKEWGRNIALYLGKRTSAKGAIVLIDAEVGPKDSDFNLLELLGTAEMRTTIVLTKADKVKNGIDGLRETSLKLWEALQDIEHKLAEKKWDWDKEIFVTAVGAKDHSVVSSTVATARLAVARLAGLVNDNRPKQKRDQGWSGKVISFDDLQYTPKKGPTPTLRPTNSSRSSSNHRVSAGEGEHAPKEQYNTNLRAAWPLISSSSFSTACLSRGPMLQHARAFHTTAPYYAYKPAAQKNNSQPPKTDRHHAQLQSIIDDFTESLKSGNTPRDHLRRRKQEREKEIPVPQPDIFRLEERREAQRLNKRFPAQTQRTKAVHDRRLFEEKRKMEKLSRRRLEEEQALKAKSVDDWPTEAAPAGKVKATKGMSTVMDADAFSSFFERVDDITASNKGKGQKGKGKGRGRGKGNGNGQKTKKAAPPLDPFEAEFAQRVVSGKVTPKSGVKSTF